MNIIYPDDGKAHAYKAKIIPSGQSVPQSIVSNPVQLTVSKGTRLSLDVSRDESSSNHVIEGWLLNRTSGGVGDKLVKIMVNETEYLLTTNGAGHFSLSLNLQPKNNKPTLYLISASFEGDLPLNATAWAYSLDGQRYPACTTTQYGYKPSSNMTTLTVEPQATHTETPTKTPEQLQQEAEHDRKHVQLLI